MAQMIAVTIGLNQVSNFYPSADPLSGCVNDAQAMAQVAQSAGFSAAPPLLNDAAKRGTVIGAIQDAASRLNDGDIFLLHYSGHGMQGDLSGQIHDQNGVFISCWCLYDQPLASYELRNLWFGFRSGVRIWVISDSCFSGTAVKAIQLPGGPPPIRARRLTLAQQQQTIQNHPQYFRSLMSGVGAAQQRDPREIPAGILLMSGCQTTEESGDLPDHGVFTSSFLSVWNQGGFQGTNYPQFYNAVRDATHTRNPNQTPNYFPFGNPAVTPDFDENRPFA
jgi:hypothetical protein